jgi:hypothetical protein
VTTWGRKTTLNLVENLRPGGMSVNLLSFDILESQTTVIDMSKTPTIEMIHTSKQVDTSMQVKRELQELQTYGTVFIVLSIIDYKIVGRVIKVE